MYTILNLSQFEDSLFGYKHLKLREINGGIIIAFALLVTQYNLKHRISKLFPQ